MSEVVNIRQKSPLLLFYNLAPRPQPPLNPPTTSWPLLQSNARKKKTEKKFGILNSAGREKKKRERGERKKRHHRWTHVFNSPSHFFLRSYTTSAHISLSVFLYFLYIYASVLFSFFSFILVASGWGLSVCLGREGRREGGGDGELEGI